MGAETFVEYCIRRNKLSFMANNIKIQKTIRSRYVYIFKNILMHMSQKNLVFQTLPDLGWF